MSGSDFVFNTAKGRVHAYSLLPLTNDAIRVVLFKSSGLETDSTLKDRDTLADITGGTAATTVESTATNYVRKSAASVTITVDDTNDRVDIDCADITWTALGGASNDTLAKLGTNYDDDTTTGTDSALIPLTAHSFDVTTDGTDLTATINNFYRAA